MMYLIQAQARASKYMKKVKLDIFWFMLKNEKLKEKYHNSKNEKPYNIQQSKTG